jgi:hypothetical protein
MDNLFGVTTLLVFQSDLKAREMATDGVKKAPGQRIPQRQPTKLRCTALEGKIQFRYPPDLEDAIALNLESDRIKEDSRE